MNDYIEREAVIALCQCKVPCDGVTHNVVNQTLDLMEYNVYRLPAADVAPVIPALWRAVKLLHKEYEKAKQNPVVRDPVAYALYQTWKIADGGK